MSTANLRQLNVSYSAVQDRLLLKAFTADDAEYRIWCTRRLTCELLRQLEARFEQEAFQPGAGQAAPGPGSIVPEQARREVAQMQHRQTVAEEAFQKPYAAQPAAYPLGEDGLLATALKYRELPDQSAQIHLGDASGRGLALNLSPHFLHQTYELFTRAAARAHWFPPATAPAIVH